MCKMVTQLVKSLYHGKHIDAMADREMAITHANPASYSSFLHTYKDSQAKSMGDPSFWAVKARQNRTNIIFCRLSPPAYRLIKHN